MDERRLLALGVLLGAASGKAPAQWLSSAHEALRAQQRQDPMNAAAMTVLLGAAAFYAVERKDNPKIESFLDALIYASTNISVGYSDILAQTGAGKAIGSALMTYGPALAARAFDPPKGGKASLAGSSSAGSSSARGTAPTTVGASLQEVGAEQLAALHAISDRLDAILAGLERLTAPQDTQSTEPTR